MIISKLISDLINHRIWELDYLSLSLDFRASYVSCRQSYFKHSFDKTSPSECNNWINIYHFVDSRLCKNVYSSARKTWSSMPGIPIDLLQRQVKLVHIASQRPFTGTQSRCDASLQEASRLYNLQSCGMFTNSFFTGWTIVRFNFLGHYR